MRTSWVDRSQLARRQNPPQGVLHEQVSEYRPRRGRRTAHRRPWRRGRLRVDDHGAGTRGQLRRPAGCSTDLSTQHRVQLRAITPCRIVDTREGTGTGHTPIGNLQTRTYFVGGTFGFAPQGGKPGGCGIPVGATAIATTFIAVNPTNKGGLRAWPNGQPEPTANVLNYGTFTMTGNPTTTINPSTAYSLKVR